MSINTLPSFATVHLLDPGDAPIVTAMRAAMRPAKGVRSGIEARPQFDFFMEMVAPPDGVTFEKETLAGVSGLWVRPQNGRADAAVLYLHGGWFTLGSAWAYRFLVGHIARRANANVFVPDYRLAPEHPFPAAVDDVLGVYRELRARHVRHIAIAGDSAGGNLALSLVSRLVQERTSDGATPIGAVAFSPVTDLVLSGASYETRAEQDPLFTRPQVAAFVDSYLAGADPKHRWASPLYADLSGLPPVQIHVGDDEVLLDDSLRYTARAAAAGVDARVEVWMGMPHGFVQNVGLRASTTALDAVGSFLADRFGALDRTAKSG